jgi:hypothetical protein
MDTGRPVQPRASLRVQTGGQSAAKHTHRSRPTRCQAACVCGSAPAAPPARPATGLGGKGDIIVGKSSSGPCTARHSTAHNPPRCCRCFPRHPSATCSAVSRSAQPLSFSECGHPRTPRRLVPYLAFVLGPAVINTHTPVCSNKHIIKHT